MTVFVRYSDPNPPRRTTAMQRKPSRSGIIVRLTIPQMEALLEAADEYRQNLVDNGLPTRALDNAADRLTATLVAVR